MVFFASNFGPGLDALLQLLLAAVLLFLSPILGASVGRRLAFQRKVLASLSGILLGEGLTLLLLFLAWNSLGPGLVGAIILSGFSVAMLPGAVLRSR